MLRSRRSSSHMPSRYTWNTTYVPFGETAAVRTRRPATGDAMLCERPGAQVEHVHPVLVRVADPLPVGEPRARPRLPVAVGRQLLLAATLERETPQVPGARATRLRPRCTTARGRQATTRARPRSRARSLGARACHRAPRRRRRARRHDPSRTRRAIHPATTARGSSARHRRRSSPPRGPRRCHRCPRASAGCRRDPPSGSRRSPRPG